MRSISSRLRAKALPRISVMLSSAPTSWKCTLSIVVLCMAASASANTWKASRARFWALWGMPERVMKSLISGRWRAVWSIGASTCRCRARTPQWLTSSTPSVTGRLSVASIWRIGSIGAPASIKAARSMSPAMPLKQSRCAVATKIPNPPKNRNKKWLGRDLNPHPHYGDRLLRPACLPFHHRAMGSFRVDPL